MRTSRKLLRARWRNLKKDDSRSINDTALTNRGFFEPSACPGFFLPTAMLKYYLIFIMLFCSALILSGQTNPDRGRVERAYDSFKETFQKEFEHTPQTKEDPRTSDMAMVYYPPVNLPGWFFDHGSRTLQDRRMIGISDPGVDSLAAYEQAVRRAMALLALSADFRIETIMDNYYNERSGTKTLGKFNVFTSINADMPVNEDDFELLESYYAPTGEMIVLVGLKDLKYPPDTCNTVKCFVENFESEQTLSRRPVYLKRTALDFAASRCSGMKSTASWVRNESMDRYEIISGMDTLAFEMVYGAFKYIEPDFGQTKLPEENFPQFFSLDKGLWNGYFTALLNRIEQIDQQYNSQIKNLDENYDEQFQGLTRVIFTAEGSFSIKRTIISDNRILLELD